MRACRTVVFGVMVFLGTAVCARAAPCPVPTGSHPTIQSAVDDASCTEVQLGGQTYTEVVSIGRTLALSGVSSATSVIAGRVNIRGASTIVAVADLTIDGSDEAVAGCFSEALAVEDSAQMSGNNLVVINGDGTACVLFEDGFEDGTTGAWSNTSP